MLSFKMIILLLPFSLHTKRIHNLPNCTSNKWIIWFCSHINFRGVFTIIRLLFVYLSYFEKQHVTTCFPTALLSSAIYILSLVHQTNQQTKTGFINLLCRKLTLIYRTYSTRNTLIKFYPRNKIKLMYNVRK